MLKNLIQLYRTTRELHASIVSQSEAINNEATKADLNELADTALAMRSIAEFADEIRKRANSIKELAEKAACMVAVSMRHVGPIETEYCKATPEVKPIATLPDKRRNPEEYAALMQYYGIPELAYAGDNPLMQVYWPGVMERLNADLAAGKPTPPGIDPSKTTNKFTLSIRRKKGVLE